MENNDKDAKQKREQGSQEQLVNKMRIFIY